MERASATFVKRFLEEYNSGHPIHVFCGPGNNGGDGLAVARMLLARGYEVSVYLVQNGKFSVDNSANLERLRKLAEDKIIVIDGALLPELRNNSIVIDALFGTGLTRPVKGLEAEVIRHINKSDAHVVSIDVPSGLFCDMPNQKKDAVIEADRTFTFACPKLSFFICENEKYTGKLEVLDIGLLPDFLDKTETSYQHITGKMAKRILKLRERCGHKGNYGHALLIAGSYGKMGAALLSGEACLRAGAGLLTMHIPKCGYEIVQTALPEAMASVDAGAKKINYLPDLERYKSVGIGPGIGIRTGTASVLQRLLEMNYRQLVLDADALNILSENKHWMSMLPAETILTPHPKEFERLAGSAANDWERMGAAQNFANHFKCVLILKGGYTSIHFPDGNTWFNTTGNPGMATGGAGDVLTGILTGLLAQGYSPQDAAVLGVYLHGLAGDIAAQNKSQWGMLAGDIIRHLGDAFKLLS